MTQTNEDDAPGTECDVVVVGAGFSGLYALHKLRGQGLSVQVLEAGDGVGGTWFWNRYPGARCDAESIAYSYSFDDELQQEWNWTERYPRQPEILSYLNHAADRFDLRPDIRLNTRVVSAHFDDDANRWTIRAEGGERFVARYVVMASGNLNVEKVPDFPGLDTFEGSWHHTSRWPKEPVEFSGRRVGVIGTGSTGIQIVPVVAEEAEHLFVFQRTANFSYAAQNRPLEPEFVREVKANYTDYRRRARERAFGSLPFTDPPREPVTGLAALAPEEREDYLRTLWDWGHAPSFLGSFRDVLVNMETNDIVADFFRSQIRAKVEDPEVAEALLPPRDLALGSKRLCLDINYYETFNRGNVTLVNLKNEATETITPKGLRTTAREYELDILVLATGFDAMTGALLAIDIRGRGGIELRSQWAVDGPRTYLGLAMAGFPNLFVVTGPQSPSVLTQMVSAIEQHVEWISDCIAYLCKHGIDRIEATREAQDAWVEHADEVADATVFRTAKSWYTGTNIEGKPRRTMPYIGGTLQYRSKLEEATSNGYAGFRLRRARSDAETAAA